MNYETEFLLKVWNRFWFGNGLEPEIIDVPAEYSESQWIVIVYNELLKRNIWPILEQKGWHRDYINRIIEDRHKQDLLEQQREGLG
jgi:hypothetical protein